MVPAVLMLLVAGGEFAVAAEMSLPFSIRRQGEDYWLVKPNGDRFFSLGVCCVNPGTSTNLWNPANPGYAAWQHYDGSNSWAAATVQRLKAWSFTTIGGWSDFQTLGACRGNDLAFAPVLHMGATAGLPWWDLWDPRLVSRMDEAARESILPLRDDPRVMGYYTDNEIGWWNAILFEMTLQQAPASGQRQRLLQLLRQTYNNDWTALIQDFEAAPLVESWEQLERHGILYLRAGGKGIQVVRKFVGILAERYYALAHDAVRKYHPRALILGDRYPTCYYPEVVRACAPFVDAVSCNLNPVWNDGTFPRFQLETLHTLSGRPVIIGEFYMAARENRSGNRNTHGKFPVVATQKERATGFRNTVSALLGMPQVIGADWFQYHDEPTHGRFDGENFNFGLVDIYNRPYEALTSAAAALDLTGVKGGPSHSRPHAGQGVPRAPRRPFAAFERGRALQHWDRERGYVRPLSPHPLADLYLCWDDKAIYLGLCAQDIVEDVFYRGKTVPASDRAAWTVTLPGWNRPIRGRIGAGMEPVFDEPSARVMNISGIEGNVPNIAALALPAKLFGKRRFRQGNTIEFSSTFYTHCRAYRVDWNGKFILRR